MLNKSIETSLVKNFWKVQAVVLKGAVNVKHIGLCGLYARKQISEKKKSDLIFLFLFSLKIYYGPFGFFWK